MGMGLPRVRLVRLDAPPCDAAGSPAPDTPADTPSENEETRLAALLSDDPPRRPATRVLVACVSVAAALVLAQAPRGDVVAADAVGYLGTSTTASTGASPAAADEPLAGHLATAATHETTVLIDPVVDIDVVVEISTASAPPDPAAASALAAEALNGPAGPPGPAGIPVTVLAAYRAAEAALAASRPTCHLPWWLLAGIGRIESGHASGGRVDEAGATRGRILGPRLDGSLPGTAVILDSDGGLLDGDPAFDRAVGPMQFLPGTWRAYARDGNADGVADPHNVYDAATTAGEYLCRAGGDLSLPENLARAVLAYNYSQAYLRSVLSWGVAYRDGVMPDPDASGSIPSDPTPLEPSPSESPTSEPTTTSTPTPATTSTTRPPPATPPPSTSRPTASPSTSGPTTSGSSSPATGTTAPLTTTATTTATTATTTTAGPLGTTSGGSTGDR